ncbi:polysaccharide pyruvyl transferase family protein [Zhongshania sp. BJYM1]|uniref:polysaccharide pyruvyl transferase family protein n=1 Tax=Zhongshania aquatica TaxID=2965069 RepID=UPI0022B3C1F4|nr:polysaccharide pyruvyl transferase family protein [Marortus sp. BJYM1]
MAKKKDKSGASRSHTSLSKRSEAVPSLLSAAAKSKFQQALAHHKNGQWHLAAPLYEQVLTEFPQHADSLHLLGLVAQALQNTEQACTLIAKAIKLNPKVAQYHFNYGVVLQGMGNDVGAIDAYRHAIRLKPDYYQAYENLGVALQDTVNDDAALKAYQQALAYQPKSVLALKNLGTLYFKSGHTTLSLQCFDEALCIAPADAELRLKRSGSLLRSGRWKEGWQEYRWRFSASSFLESNPPRSRGLPHTEHLHIAGRRLLISCEQGLGDEIMFASCFDDVMALAEHCVLECDPRLVSLFTRSFPSAEVVPKSHANPVGLDSFIPAGDLPMHFRRGDEDFSGRAYLHADTSKQSFWQTKLQALGKTLKVGICWRGGTEVRAMKERSIALKYWQTLFANTDVSYINLQYRCEADELAQLGENVHSFADLDAFNDIENLAALMANLDLVISVDNTTVHLAGALGVPVWILLPRGAERRWTDDSESSLWYSSAQLFRNSSGVNDSWADVMAAVAERLTKLKIKKRSELVISNTAEAQEVTAVTSVTAKTSLFLNDTSDWYHWGCSGTSLSIHRALRAKGYDVNAVPIAWTQNLLGLPKSPEGFDSDEVYADFCAQNTALIESIAAADIVLINGEGTLHGGGIVPVGLLYLAFIAKNRLAKSVQIINHSCYPQDADMTSDGPLNQLYKRVYQQLDYIAVREPVSLRLLQSLDIKCVQSFDCLPLFINTLPALRSAVVTDKPYIVLTGSVVWGQAIAAPLTQFLREQHAKGYKVKLLIGASAFLAADDVAFVQWMQTAAAGQFELYVADTEREWLECIANAVLLVSGRFHHSIAAACLETPFIVTASNTPKVAGLLELLDMPDALLQADQYFYEHLNVMAEQRLRDPLAFLVSAERRQALLNLAKANFSFLDT